MRSTGTVHPSRWLVKLPAGRARMRLFCFPYAGGNAFIFAPWRTLLDPSVEICAVQLPGRGSRITEPPLASLPALIRELAPVVAQHDDLPYAFFGHSLGALVAFELARYLRLHGRRGPQQLFVSGCQAPQFRSPSRQLYQLDDQAFIDALRDYKGTPAEVLENQELMSLLLPAIRADFAMAESFNYRSALTLSAPINVFAGKQDDNKAPGQVDGWALETAGECRIVWYEGGHFFIESEREAVVEQVNTMLLDLPSGSERAIHTA